MVLLIRVLKWLFASLLALVILTLAGGRIYQHISESSDLRRYPAPGKLINVDGHLMHLNCIGQGSPTVIFELGVGSASAAWEEVHRQVSLTTRACAYDRAGLGYSEPIDGSRRSTDVVRRLQKLLRSAEIDDELVLVGWSAGGVYVREFFGRYPEHVKAMLFVASSHEQQASRLPQDSGGGSDPALKIARHLAPFGIVRFAGILDQRVDSGAGSDELKSRLKVIYNRSHVLDTVWKESEAFDADINATRPPSPIGPLPLIVLTPGDPEFLQQESETWKQLQQELTMLSSNGKQIIATKSGHHIYSDQPELVIESVKELVLLVRKEYPLGE